MGFLYNPMYFIFFAFKNIIPEGNTQTTRYSQQNPESGKLSAHMNCSLKINCKRPDVLGLPDHFLISFQKTEVQ